MQDRRLRRSKEEEPRSKSKQARDFCRKRGCTNATTEHKPFCSSHVDENDYAREIKEALANREMEERLANRRKPVIDVDGSRAQEIVEYMRFVGVQTPKRLAVELDLSPTELEAYLSALERAQLLRRTNIPSPRSKLKPVVVATGVVTFVGQDGEHGPVTREEPATTRPRTKSRGQRRR
jgi:hypothetical protein